MKILLVAISFLLCLNLLAQELITGTYSFQSDAAKKYAYYIPSAYDGSAKAKLIVGFHPLNTARWNGETWCQELSELAEANNTIVVCPDGGPDGRIDDPIDTAFTSFMIKQAQLDYTIHEDSIYAIGFSWGGKTVYTYGLNHPGVFAGFMPIGAAVTLSEVAPFAANMKDQNYYVIHGSNDSPVIRFNPLINLMKENEACHEADFLQGVGHTIDFANQFEILNTGFQWLLDASCNVTSVSQIHKRYSSTFLKRNTYTINETLAFIGNERAVIIYDANGRLVSREKSLSGLIPGIYIVKLMKDNGTQRIVIHH